MVVVVSHNLWSKNESFFTFISLWLKGFIISKNTVFRAIRQDTHVISNSSKKCFKSHIPSVIQHPRCTRNTRNIVVPKKHIVQLSLHNIRVTYTHIANGIKWRRNSYTKPQAPKRHTHRDLFLNETYGVFGLRAYTSGHYEGEALENDTFFCSLEPSLVIRYHLSLVSLMVQNCKSQYVPKRRI